jgi:hypothetical protein
MAMPIRFRLTIWYSGLLLLMLVGFGAAMYFRFLASLEATIDLDLQDRLRGLEHFMETEMPRFPRERLWREFEESVELRPGEMLQISLRGDWIFRSRAIQPLDLPAHALFTEPYDRGSSLHRRQSSRRACHGQGRNLFGAIGRCFGTSV